MTLWIAAWLISTIVLFLARADWKQRESGMIELLGYFAAYAVMSGLPLLLLAAFQRLDLSL